MQHEQIVNVRYSDAAQRRSSTHEMEAPTLGALLDRYIKQELPEVTRELMRQASIQATMNVYGRAMTDSKRKANSQVVGLVFGERWM